MVKKMPNKESFFDGTKGLYKLYDKLNTKYFEGKLPHYKIIWNRRFRATKADVRHTTKTIRFNYKYHKIRKDWSLELIDSMKHEMIHIWQYHVLYNGIWNT